MQPEILVQLIQLGAMGLLAFVLFNIMAQGKQILEAQSQILKSLIEGNQAIMIKLIDLLMSASDESSPVSKVVTLEAHENVKRSHVGAEAPASNVKSFDTGSKEKS